MILHGFQERFLGDIRTALRGGARSVLAVAPTGSGKTVVMCHIARGIYEAGQSLLIVVHRDELVDQTSRRLASLGVPHGRLNADTDTRDGNRVVIATIQTAVRRDLQRPDWLIYDECHLSKAKSWVTLRAQFEQARLLGFSATPCRLDGEGFDDMYSELVLGPSTRELIDWGYLVPYRALCFEAPDLSGVGKNADGDYREAELAAVMNTSGLTGDIVEHWQQHASDRLTLIFAVNVAHAHALADRFRQAGVASEAIDGRLGYQERKAVLARFGSETRVLASVMLFTEGWDRPDIFAIVLARPTMSLRLHLQMIGRGLRTAPDKRDCLILDHAGNLNKHGLPDADRAWKLEPEKKGEAPDTRDSGGLDDPEGFRLTVRECPKCRQRVPSCCVQCPECGAFLGDIKERGGSLREFSGKYPESAYGSSGGDPAIQFLIDWARRKGYKPGYVYYGRKRLASARTLYMETFGCAPNRYWSAEHLEYDISRLAKRRSKLSGSPRGSLQNHRNLTT